MKRQKTKMFFIAVAGIVTFILFTQTKFVRADDKDETIKTLLDRISNLEKKVDDLSKKVEINKSVGTASFAEEVVQKKVESMLKAKEEKKEACSRQ